MAHFVLVDACVVAAYFAPKTTKSAKLRKLAASIFECKDPSVRLLIPNFCIAEVFSVFEKYPWGGSWNKHVKDTLTTTEFSQARLSFRKKNGRADCRDPKLPVGFSASTSKIMATLIQTVARTAVVLLVVLMLSPEVGAADLSIPVGASETHVGVGRHEPIAHTWISQLARDRAAAANAVRRRAVRRPSAPPCSVQRGGEAVEVMNGWIIDGDQTVENRTIALNGMLEIRRGTLTLRNVAIEISSTSPSSSNSGAVVAVDIRSAAGLVLSGVRIRATSAKLGVIQGDQAAMVTAENTCFQHTVAVLTGTGELTLLHNELALEGNDGVPAVTIMNTLSARLQDNTIRFALDPATERVSNGAGGIYLFFSHNCTISGNTIIGAANGISLWGSWNNRVSGNTWNGPTAVTPIHESTTNWWSISTPAIGGEAGISLSWWSNNNTIDKNTLMGAQSAILFVLQSKANTISGNVIRGAGYGVTLRWASEILIDDNDLTDVFSDAVHVFRSHDVTITNNRIRTSGFGISLYASARNRMASNSIEDIDRGIFLHTSSDNAIERNTVGNALQGIFVASSPGNELTQNNIVDALQPAWDDGQNNSWRKNYWSAGAPAAIPPGAAADPTPAATLWPSTAEPVIPVNPIPYKKPLGTLTSIRDQQVWEGARTVNGAIEIESGGTLTLRGATLNYDVPEPTASIWINVRDGGSLIIEDSTIIGPEWDHTLSIKIYKGAHFTMKRSELRNAGSWVGTFAAAIANEADNISVEDSVFTGTYCALSGENGPANTRFVNNAVARSVKAIELIGPHPGAVITGNRISQAAMWGIGIWPYAGFAPSRVTDNVFSDSWGPAIKNYFNAGSFEIARNTFTNVRGPGVLTMETNAQTESRQVHVVSTTVSAAQQGDSINAVLKLANILTGPLFTPVSRVFLVRLEANGKLLESQRIPIPFGQFQRVVLHATAGESGAYEIRIDTEPQP